MADEDEIVGAAVRAFIQKITCNLLFVLALECGIRMVIPGLRIVGFGHIGIVMPEKLIDALTENDMIQTRTGTRL